MDNRAMGSRHVAVLGGSAGIGLETARLLAGPTTLRARRRR